MSRSKSEVVVTKHRVLGGSLKVERLYRPPPSAVDGGSGTSTSSDEVKLRHNLESNVDSHRKGGGYFSDSRDSRKTFPVDGGIGSLRAVGPPRTKGTPRMTRPGRCSPKRWLGQRGNHWIGVTKGG